MHWLFSWAHSGRGKQRSLLPSWLPSRSWPFLAFYLILVDRAPKTGREKWQAFLFLLPALILVLIGLLIPIIHTAIESLTDTHNHFTFGNYSWAFGNKEVAVGVQEHRHLDRHRRRSWPPASACCTPP